MNITGPSWLADSCASVMLIVAVYSAARLPFVWASPRRTHVDSDVAHLLMGVAMAGMFAPALNALPAGLWEVVFAVVAAWSVCRCIAQVTRRGKPRYLADSRQGVSCCPPDHYPTHVVMAFAMLYMYLVAPTATLSNMGSAMTSSASGTTADFVELPLLFLLVLLGSCVFELDRAGRLWREREAQGLPAPAVQPTARTVLVGALNGARLSAAPAVTKLVPIVADGTKDQPRPGPWLTPGFVAASHVAMCIIMGYMLVAML